MKSLYRLTLYAGLAALPVSAFAKSLEVTVSNPLALARSSETIEISAKDLESLGAKNLNTIHVKDSEGKEVLCQAIDLDGDPLRTFDAVIFQADFAANEKKTFTLSVGEKQVYKLDQYKAFGRFNRERFDDFAWENDRIAHRTYGKTLETWEGEPLTSSTVDIWSKRTPRMVINDWYLADDYHVDYGDGADFYSAGLSRGCGGSGIWANDQLWVSRNFVNSKVLANGPIRVLFELEYEPYSVNGVSIAEKKRISLDAGQQLSRVEIQYKPYVLPAKATPIVAAAGLKKVKNEELAVNAEQGWIAKWERTEKKDSGYQGLAIVARPADFEKHQEDTLNHLVLLKTDSRNTTTYWSGFAWDKAGLITDLDAWKTYLDAFSQSLAAPLEVQISASK
ncbi:MAG: DUF4861 family protein [Luteolibacter sp.]